MILKPLKQTGLGFYLFVGVLAIISAWGLYAWWIEFRFGLLTDLNNSIIWGLNISTFIFMIGISHAGILISSTVRLMNLKKYKPVARMAEVLTIVSLLMAVLYVVVDLGRPDRVLNLFLTLKLISPLAWDFIFIMLYLLLSAFYLFVSLKEDIIHLVNIDGNNSVLYRILIRVYDIITPKDNQSYEKMLRWVAYIILPFPVFGSGMVVPFIFSLLVAKPAWNVPFFGPYFVTAAIVSGVSAVIVIAVILRSVFNWEKIISSDLIIGLGNFLKLGIPVYVYFTFVEQFTIQYVQEHADIAVSNYILWGPYALYYWGMILLGLVVPEILLLFPKTRNVKGVFIASILVTVALWMKRVIIVIPALIYPNLPHQMEIYTPTWVEWSTFSGIIGVGILLYSLFIKLFPIVELDVDEGLYS
jgi:molybdopterin-containing oxidoreductase family membrane subunit